jgi:hypothetical protein
MKNKFIVVVSVFLVFSSHSLLAVLPQKVVICGVCKDVETKLPYMKKTIEGMGLLFTDYRVVIYENNSSDRTAKKLRAWAKENRRVSVRTERLTETYLKNYIVNRGANQELFRPELIARARNIVQKKAMSSEYADFPYIIWVDMDFSVFPDLEGLIEVFTTDREWDAIFAYGIVSTGPYWDWYALRSEQFPFGPELLGRDWYQSFESREKSIQLNKESDWFPVYSAFGGCGIYKKSSIVDCWYSGLVTQDTEKLMRILVDQGISSLHSQALLYQEKERAAKEFVHVSQISSHPNIQDQNIGIILHEFENSLIWRMNTFTFGYPSVCEHVPFHASMIMNGHGKLFINPRLIFTY